MGNVVSQRVQIGLFLGVTMLGLGMCLLIGMSFLKTSVLSPVRAPFPGAILEAVTLRPASADSLMVTRRYQVAAPFREVAEWYQGKDSLMPLPAAMGSSCFHQSFRRSLALIPGVVRGGTTEAVTICPSPGGVAVTSITTTHFPVFAP